ncbi:MAG: AraC family transcriptional regulator [Acidobacteria bacterium]|nr:AraC family transcriptional regulator [Acidobacteriota bacterium]
MISQIHIPVSPLNQYFEIFFYYKGAQPSHSVERFLPNGDTEILIDFQDRPQHIYDNNTLKEIQACHHVWTSGVRTEPITIPSGTDSEMMVLMFKKGMAASFFPFPMNEIANTVLDAELVWGSDLALLREQMLGTQDIDERFRMAEDLLLRKFASKLMLNPCIAYAVNEMRTNPDRLNIARMNHNIGYSQKHFTDMFKRQVGITPKAYLKIMRFQQVLMRLENVPVDVVDWPSIAFDSGFYDQSHFIHDFKMFSGFTPLAYLEKSIGVRDYVPVG